MKRLEKKHTQSLYGCAILMMLFHHLFSVPERINGIFFETYSNNHSLFIALAWSCKLCVAIYSFLSGYGMIKTSCLNNKIEKYNIMDEYKTSIKRYFRFMKKYWIVFTIFYLLGLAINKVEVMSFDELVRCLLGVSDYINREWWYVKQYIIFLIFFPVLELFIFDLKKKKYGQILFCAISICCAILLYISFTSFGNAIILVRNILGSPVYWIIFLCGTVCAAGRFFERLSCYLPKNNYFNYLIGIGFIIIVFSIRIILSTDADYNDIDIFLILPLIYGLILIINSNHYIEKILCQLGKHSTYIWLTHTFYCYYYFGSIFKEMHSKIIQFATLLIVSYVTAILLLEVQKKIELCFIYATKWRKSK